MKSRSYALIKISILFMVLSLTACTEAKEPSTSPIPPPPTNEENTAPTTENEQGSESVRPQNEKFEMLTSEGNQTLMATLQQGEGFSLYVFEKFTFDASKGRLSLSDNTAYEVNIKSLPANYDLTQLETAGKEELEGFGEVSDFSGELVEHPLGSAELYLQATSGEGIRDYIVWQSKDGDAFLFRLHNPKGEEASDFAAPVFVSLSTVQSVAIH